MAYIILSILIISHNQRDLLKRCMKSVLDQELNVPYEIIISDDRSTDGTWELIEDYMRLYPKTVFGYKCNSDECSPVNTSERCGWNKLNAYEHATGLFFVNIDADDYLLSKDVYQKQVDLLLKHPDCSMCMQRISVIPNGEQTYYIYPEERSLVTGSKISAEDVILKHVRTLNQAYVIRRSAKDKMRELYGKWFDDTIITYHHLQYGPVIFLDRSDYAWIQYPNSISNTQKKDARILMPLLVLHHCLMVPKYRYLFLAGGIKGIGRLTKDVALQKAMPISEDTRAFLAENKGWLFDVVTCNYTPLFSRVRAMFCWLMSLFIRKFGLESKFFYEILYKLLMA